MYHEYISKEFKSLNPLIFNFGYFMQLQQRNCIQFLKAKNLKVRYLTYLFFKKFLRLDLLNKFINSNNVSHHVPLVVSNVLKETLIQKII